MTAPAVLTRAERDELLDRLQRGMHRAGRLTVFASEHRDLWEPASALLWEISDAHHWVCDGLPDLRVCLSTPGPAPP